MNRKIRVLQIKWKQCLKLFAAVKISVQNALTVYCTKDPSFKRSTPSNSLAHSITVTMLGIVSNRP